MRNFLFATLLTMGSLSVNASVAELNGTLDSRFFEAEVFQDKTYFETLGDMFKTGTMPNLNKIQDIAWAGRCFISDKPNEPINAGYVFRLKKSDVGPIASSTRAYEATSYWMLSKAANFFDDKTLSEVLSPSFWQTHNFNMPGFRDVNVAAGEVTIDLMPGDVSRLKLSGNYLVEEISKAAADVGPVGKIEVAARCYYFIPEYSN